MMQRLVPTLIALVVPMVCLGCGSTEPAARTISGIELIASDTRVGVGGTLLLTARVTDANGADVTDADLSWSAGSRLQLAATGLTATVTGLTSGSARVIAAVANVADTVDVVVEGVPQPSATDRIILDLRQPLQAATTVQAALALFPGSDHSSIRSAPGQTGWSFSTNYDGQGTRALRADWGVNAGGDLDVKVLHSLPSPKPREMCVQWKGRLGRHPSDPDGNGAINDFPLYPVSQSAKRMLILRDGVGGSATARIDYTLTRDVPSTARFQINDMNWAVGANPSQWQVAQYVGRVFTTTICARASSTDGAPDGSYRLWIDGRQLLDVTGNMRGFAFDRWQFPDTNHNNPRPAAEYFWDVLVWVP